MIKGVICIIALFILANTGFSQGDSGCLAEVLAYNKRMEFRAKPRFGRVYHMSYRQQIDYWDPSIKAVDMSVKYYISEDQVHVLSNEMKSYMDKKYVFTVLDGQKKIIITRNPSEEVNPTSVQTFIKNQKGIIERCKVTECSEDATKGIRKIVLDASDINVKGFAGDELIYYFDSKSGDLSKTITTYSRAYKIRRMSITVDKLDFNSSYKFPAELTNMFLESNGELKAKYKGYQLIKE